MSAFDHVPLAGCELPVITFRDPPPPVIIFHDEAGKPVGTFERVDGKWRFEGDCEASAQVFVDVVVRRFNAMEPR